MPTLHSVSELPQGSPPQRTDSIVKLERVVSWLCLAEERIRASNSFFQSILLVVCLQTHLAFPSPKPFQGSVARTGLSLEFSNAAGIQFSAFTDQLSLSLLNFPTCKMLLALYPSFLLFSLIINSWLFISPLLIFYCVSGESKDKQVCWIHYVWEQVLQIKQFFEINLHWTILHQGKVVKQAFYVDLTSPLSLFDAPQNCTNWLPHSSGSQFLTYALPPPSPQHPHSSPLRGTSSMLLQTYTLSLCS